MSILKVYDKIFFMKRKNSEKKIEIYCGRPNLVVHNCSQEGSGACPYGINLFVKVFSSN